MKRNNDSQLVLLSSLAQAIVLVSLFAPYSLMAANARSCQWAGLIHLSRGEMRSHLVHSEPMHPPCCSRGLTLVGSVKLRVAFDAAGDVICIDVVKGVPIAVQSAMESVKQWKFRPVKLNGKASPAVGGIVVRYHLTDQVSESHVD